MAGSIFSDIDPNVTSGTDLANLLNDFKDAYASKNKGAVRPTNILAGGTWVDDSLEISNAKLKYMLYDGSTDLELLRVDKNTGGVTIGSIADSIDVQNTDDSAVGALANLIKGRATGNQALDGDTLGQLNFIGLTASSVEEISARIEVIVTDDVTASAHGSDMIFSTTPDGLGALTEIMRIANTGKVGIGVTSPDEKLHVKGNDITTAKIENAVDSTVGSTVEVAKARLSGNGQTLSGDDIGKVVFTGKESTGTKAELAKIEVITLENTDTGNHGSELVICRKPVGSGTYEEVFRADEAGVTIPGVDSTTLNQTVALLHGGVTQDLFTIDSAVYGSFVAEVNVFGSSLTERCETYTIKGVYDGTNWYTTFDNNILNNDHVIDLVFTDAAVLDVDYDNVMNQGGFTTGKIYMKIRRFAQ